MLLSHKIEPWTHQALTQIQQYEQYEDDFQCCYPQRHEHSIAVAAEYWQNVV